ncbi:MAG: TonB-dependent receptor [Bacteroidota bacterium]
MYKNYLFILFLFVAQASLLGQGKINGTITDTEGEPLLGATVLIEGTNIGATTDVDGTFEIGQVPLGNRQLEISSLGFQKRMVSVTLERGKTLSLTVALQESNEALDEVVVQGKSNEQRKREEPIKIEVLSVDEVLERATSITELINQTSGIKIRQAAGVGSETTININGLQGNAVRFFRDGVPSDYLGRAFSLGLVPTGSIQSVEIYKGVLPVELGADALGGAINIVSKSKNTEYLDLSYELGSFNTHILNLGANVIIPKTKIHVGVNSYYTGSDNDYEFSFERQVGQDLEVINASRFHDAIFSTFVEFNAGVHDTKFADLFDVKYAYFALDNEIQNGIFIDQPFGEITEGEINRVLSFQYKKALLDNWNLNIFGALGNRNTELQDLGTRVYDWNGEFSRDSEGDLLPPIQGEQDQRDQKIQEDVKVARIFSEYEFSDKINLKLSSTYNGFERVGTDPFSTPNPLTGIQPITIPSEYTKIISGLGLGLSLFNDKLKSETFVKNYYLETVSPNLSFSETLTTDFFFRDFGWGQSFKYAFDGDTFVRISYEDAIRIPEAEEYFGDNVFILPNPELSPERSDNLNVGLSTNLNSAQTVYLELNAFYRSITDFIQLLPQGLINSINQNSDAQEVKGIEGNLKVHLGGNTTINGALTFQDIRVKESATNPQLVDARRPNVPYYFTNLSASKEFIEPFGCKGRLNLYGNYLYTEQYFRFFILKSLEPPLFGEVPNSVRNSVIPTQHQVNLGLTYTFEKVPLSLNLEAINVLEDQLFDNFGIPKPLRNYRLKLTYRLK